MGDLAQWLGEQLDEDARRASSWHALECDIHAYLQGDLDSVKATMAMFHDAPGAVCDCGTPARALREIDAKRQVLAAYARTVQEMEDGTNRRVPLSAGSGDLFMTEVEHASAVHRRDALREVLHLLALPYADRPGYLTSWRP
ncbi:hypothetical protein G3I40_28280 [Streptomyces sp. SID14478]|uniref:DUF6221 family protein n=1 Tax=Streptomyces sp. SID14478 TaxID=2706073 RepID=UPI0013DAE0C4|nr:DUF6221 family protein [Streptomyces sp. SID14478]NEB79087.1 hypothetical protein [Streptomyces sp. SID14478]